ncbi:MAG: CYTH domain-containing protein [Promethearchaeota archaeon]
MKNKEIEIKLQFKNKRKIISILGKKIKFQKRLRIHDEYYNRSWSDMRNTHDLVRIRSVKNGNAELTYKGKAKDKNNIWHRIELTTSIMSPGMMKKILDNIGLKKISECQSEREYWQIGNLEIVFVKFNLPVSLEIMEIEGTSEKEIRDMVKKLSKYVKKVGEEIFSVFDKERAKTRN